MKRRAHHPLVPLSKRLPPSALRRQRRLGRGQTYRGAPAERYALVRGLHGDRDLGRLPGDHRAGACHLANPGGGRTIYGEYLAPPAQISTRPAASTTSVRVPGRQTSTTPPTAAYLEGIGYAQIQGGPILGIDRNGRFDYFEADARLGLTLELLDMPEVYGTPEYEYP